MFSVSVRDLGSKLPTCWVVLDRYLKPLDPNPERTLQWTMSTGQLTCHDTVTGLLAYAQEHAALASETAERFRSTAAAAQEVLNELQAQQHTISKKKAHATSSQLAVRELSCAPGAVDDEAVDKGADVDRLNML